LTTDTVSGRVLKALADSGVFHLDGVLLDTHAFLVLGNLLGVHWDHAAMRTQDIDIGGTETMSVGLPDLKADVPQALEGLEMGFVPVPPFNPRDPSTSFRVRGNPVRVDALTPERRPGKERRTVFIPRFNVSAQPLRFLDFLISEPVRGAVVDGGGVLVNVPQPARFALHKLMVARERELTAQTKVANDLAQAAQLLEVLMDERPGDLSLAWEALERRGTGWVKRVRRALKGPTGDHEGAFEKAAAFLKL
jgi:hypothetical protein